MSANIFEILRRDPKITVIMTVRDTDCSFLDAAINSVRMQDYKNWELCIVNGGSTIEATSKYLKAVSGKNIKVRFLKDDQSYSAALNDTVSMAKGSWIAFMNSRDLLTKDALKTIAATIHKKDADMVYSDEDVVSPTGKFERPYFKPGYSADALLSYNYIGYITAVKKHIVAVVGGFRDEFKEAKYYDLWLRCVEKTQKICRIPKILYHRRGLLCNVDYEAMSDLRTGEEGKRAVAEACARRGIDATVLHNQYVGTYRVRRNIVGNPAVSIIIPFKDKAEYLKSCIDSILEKTSYKNFDILGIDNNSREKETASLIREYELSWRKIKFIRYNGEFNYSKMNNAAVNLSVADHVVLLNNDMEVIKEDWLDELLAHSQRPEVGAVGGKLYYPDGRVQHAGVVVGMNGVAGHVQKDMDDCGLGYFYRGAIIQNMSAVTGACMMIKRKLYLDMGGLNEDHLPVGFSDTDLCLRLAEKGYNNIFTPYCELVHHESASRNKVTPNYVLKRMIRGIEYFKLRHKKVLKEGDPYYSPNLPLNIDYLGFLKKAVDSKGKAEIDMPFYDRL